MATPTPVPTDHDCNDHIDIEWWDHDWPYPDHDSYTVEGPICGFHGLMCVAPGAIEVPDDAEYYHANPDL
jgi:hypothetical protein